MLMPWWQHLPPPPGNSRWSATASLLVGEILPGLNRELQDLTDAQKDQMNHLSSLLHSTDALIYSSYSSLCWYTFCALSVTIT